MPLTLSALFAALIGVARFVTIQLSFTPIPIVFQDMMVLLTGVLLGPLYGTISVALFLTMGALGLPVLSSGAAGLQAIIASPTAGFVLGYLAAAFTAGLVTDKLEEIIKPTALYITASVAGTIVLFTLGVAGFALITKSTLAVTVASVIIPFIPGNILKIVIIVALAKKWKGVIKNYIKETVAPVTIKSTDK